MGEPGRATLPVQPAQEPVGHERRDAVLGAKWGRPSKAATIDLLVGQAAIATLRQVVEIGLLRLGQPQFHPKPRRHPLVGAQPGAVRRQDARVGAGVGVAEQDRIPAGRTGNAGQGLVPRIQRRAVGDRAVVQCIEAGVERGPRRAARRGLREMPLEQDRVGGEAVEVGGAHRRMAEAGEAVASPLVGGDEEYVHGGAFRPLQHRRRSTLA